MSLREGVVALTLLGLAGCNQILGISSIHTSDDDAGSNAGPSDVHGAAIDTSFTSPTTMTTTPEDLSGGSIQAYIPDDSPSGFHIVSGAGGADGTFTIPNVPAGPYLLLGQFVGSTPAFYETTSHSVDLGFFRAGRPGPGATQSTNMTVNLTGMTATQNSDELFIDSFATATAEDFLGPPPGQTTFTFTFDWKQFGTPLLSAAKGDDLFVVHQRTTSPALNVTTQTLIDVFSTTQLTMVDGQAINVSGAFSALPATQSLQVEMSPSSWEQDLDFSTHHPIAITARMRAWFYGGVSQGSGIVGISETFGAGTSSAFQTVMYGDPFPASWVRSVIDLPRMAWAYTSRGTGHHVLSTSTAFDRQLVPAGGGFLVQLAAPLSPPHDIKVGGVAASRAAAVPFDGTHPLKIEWMPVVGVVHYSVIAQEIVENGDGTAGLKQVATFDTYKNDVTVPGTLFQVGHSYVFNVVAILDRSTDYPGGALLRIGFPNSERDAATARLLFASSCGNGTVDAAYEECDSSGTATATCNPDCTKPVCGDGFANAAAGEQCDDAGESLACNADCTPASCGDGKVNATRGELCDLGAQNGQPGKCCSSTCTLVPPATSCTQ